MPWAFWILDFYKNQFIFIFFWYTLMFVKNLSTLKSKIPFSQ